MAIITEEAVVDIIKWIVPALTTLAGAYLGYLFSKDLFDRQRKHENFIRKEERYLELLGKFDIFLVAFSMGVKELAKEKDPIKREELKKRIDDRMFDFAGARAIVDLFGTNKMAILIEETNDAAQEMATEVINIEKEGKVITDPKELKSSAKFFSKKRELIDEIRKEIGQPVIE